MLAVHWTPVNNTKSILKNGISKSKKGVFCFPLTGHKSLDRWWIYFFNQCKVRPKNNYNGIIFRINQDDLPAYFGHWIGATSKSNFDKEIKNLKELGNCFRETILFRLGEEISIKEGLEKNLKDFQEYKKLYLELAEKAIKKEPKVYFEKYNSTDFMLYSFEDYQIVLSNSIPAKRIIKVIPQANEFGKVLRKEKTFNNLSKSLFME